MKKIVFDPGHRNNELDWGASGNGLKEATVALQIALHAIQYLKANYTGFEYKLTRSSDNQIVPLESRDEVADNWKADVFVSIHLNAANAVANGFETFIYNNLLPGDKNTPRLQSIMHDEIMAAMKQFGSIKDRGKKTANYAVLRDTDMPAILTENLFIDSAADGGYLKKPEFIKAVGQAHARGVAKYLELPAKVAPKPEPPKPKQPDYIGSPYEASIKKAMKTGAMAGYPDGNFGVNDPLTRGQMATILDRLGFLDK